MMVLTSLPPCLSTRTMYTFSVGLPYSSSLMGPRGLGDPAPGAVHDGMEVRGRSPELRLGQLHERLVGGILQRWSPEARAHDADGLVAHPAQRALVGHDAGADRS